MICSKLYWSLYKALQSTINCINLITIYEKLKRHCNDIMAWHRDAWQHHDNSMMISRYYFIHMPPMSCHDTSHCRYHSMTSNMPISWHDNHTNIMAWHHRWYLGNIIWQYHNDIMVLLWSYGDTKIGYQKIPDTVQQMQASERMTDR